MRRHPVSRDLTTQKILTRSPRGQGCDLFCSYYQNYLRVRPAAGFRRFSLKDCSSDGHAVGFFEFRDALGQLQVENHGFRVGPRLGIDLRIRDQMASKAAALSREDLLATQICGQRMS